MDKFQYNLLKNKIQTMTTKKEKEAFIKGLRLPTHGWKKVTQYQILILQDIIDAFSNPRLKYVAGLQRIINYSIMNVEGPIDLLEQLPYIPQALTNDYHYFRASTNISARIKLEVLKLIRTKEEKELNARSI